MKQIGKYGFILILGYLGLNYATGAGTLFTQGGSAASGVIKTLQGRG